jgi:hypothetical protein
VCHGFSFIARFFLLALKPNDANGITRLDVEEMNLINYESGRRGDRSEVQILSPRLHMQRQVSRSERTTGRRTFWLLLMRLKNAKIIAK